MVIRKAYLYFSFPALFLHELSHLLMCVLTLTQPFGFRLNLINGCVKYITPTNRFTNIAINLSPFLNFIIAGFLIAINVYFIVLLVYLILTYKVSLPSRIDYENIKKFGKNKDCI